MKKYIRLDPELPERKADYPDGAFAAFVMTLCAAAQQSHRGRFRNRGILRAWLGRRARWVAYLIEHGDLVEVDGVLYVDGWDEWQEGDLTVPERMARLRDRRKVTARTVTDVTDEPVNEVTDDPVTDVTDDRRLAPLAPVAPMALVATQAPLAPIARPTSSTPDSRDGSVPSRKKPNAPGDGMHPISELLGGG